MADQYGGVQETVSIVRESPIGVEPWPGQPLMLDVPPTIIYDNSKSSMGGEEQLSAYIIQTTMSGPHNNINAPPSVSLLS